MTSNGPLVTLGQQVRRYRLAVKVSPVATVSTEQPLKVAMPFTA